MLRPFVGAVLGDSCCRRSCSPCCRSRLWAAAKLAARTVSPAALTVPWPAGIFGLPSDSLPTVVRTTHGRTSSQPFDATRPSRRPMPYWLDSMQRPAMTPRPSSIIEPLCDMHRTTCPTRRPCRAACCDGLKRLSTGRKTWRPRFGRHRTRDGWRRETRQLRCTARRACVAWVVTRRQSASCKTSIDRTRRMHASSSRRGWRWRRLGSPRPHTICIAMPWGSIVQAQPRTTAALEPAWPCFRTPPPRWGLVGRSRISGSRCNCLPISQPSSKA